MNSSTATNKKTKNYTSIRTQYSISIILLVLIISILIDLCVYSGLSGILDTGISNNLNLTARNEGMKIDQNMYHIEDSVDSIASFIENYTDDFSKLQDRTFRVKMLSEIENVFTSSAAARKSVVSDYVFFNPDLLDGKEDGFLYLKNTNGEMIKTSLTNINYYAEDDDEHVGWYYIPKANRYPTWLTPYLNKNFNILMVSYIVPVFKDDTFIGVVGMDMDFRELIYNVGTLITEKGTRSYITTVDSKSHYFINDEGNVDTFNDEELIYIRNHELRKNKSSGKEIIEYKYDNIHLVMAFVTLENSMKLVVYNRYDALYSERSKILIYIVIISIILGLLFVAISVYSTQKIVNPLQSLTKAAIQIGSGNFDITLPESNIKEIKILTDALKGTNAQLKKYARNMESLAFRDEMTKVKNKTSYTFAVDNIDEQIESGDENLEFAVLMCDLNLLKPINDKYGHEAGDVALKRCAATICDVYQHSPVYRVGGDEFVVILTGNEYRNRRELEKNLDRKIYQLNLDALQPYEAISIAHGMAVYNKDTDKSYRNVFDRADAAMYQNKSNYHKELGIKPR